MFKSLRINVFAARYFIAAIVLIEMGISPILLETSKYVAVEYYKQILSFSPFLLLGINSGYINWYYATRQDLRISLAFAALALAVGFGIIIASAFNDCLFGFAASLLIMIYGVEKILIVDGKFIFSSLFKVFHSLIFLIALYYFYIIDSLPGLNSIEIFSGSVIAGSMLWLLYFISKNKYLYSYIGIKKSLKLKDVKVIFLHGWPISAQSLILLGLIFSDRWIVLNFYPSDSVAFTFGSTVSTMLIFGINTLSLTLQKDLGDMHANGNIEGIKSLVKSIVILYIALFIILILVIFLLNLFGLALKYQGYEKYAIGIYLTLGLYYAVSSISVLSAYNKQIIGPLLYMLMCGLIILLMDVYMVYKNIEFFLINLKTGLILTLFSYLSNKKYNP